VTQRTAAVLAEKFNELCEEKSLSVPKVKYLWMPSLLVINY